MKPRGIANRAMELRESRRLDPDGIFRKTFTLPFTTRAGKRARSFESFRPVAT
jgi:hypothetical protein